MLIDPHIRAPSVTPLTHGGDLVAARQIFPDAPEPFIDLSTGINPHPYPLPPLPADIFARLPDRAAVRQLAGVAAQYYGAPTADHVVPAPGAQSLLPKVAMLVAPGRAAILGPTYAEHLRAARLVGHDAVEVSGIAQLRGADLAIVVNPNNPDGRIVSRTALLELADDLRRRGGVLVVDESFADVAPDGVSLAGDAADNIVVLRSFGKFFGLAGLRLGFALAVPDIANRLDASLGPWAVAGPAILIGRTALADSAWQSRTREQLAVAADRLDLLLVDSGLEILGGTSLFRLTRSSDASALFIQLGRAGILVRRFLEDSTWLRWGLPGSEAEWQRLSAALSGRPDAVAR